MIRKGLEFVRQRCVWSLQGWRVAWASEGSLRGWAAMNVLSGALAFALPISLTQTAILIFGGLLVLVVELLNTAIERVVDYISLERHPLAGEAKDIASCAVSLTGIAVGVVWVFVLVGLVF